MKPQTAIGIGVGVLAVLVIFGCFYMGGQELERGPSFGIALLVSCFGGVCIGIATGKEVL